MLKSITGQVWTAVINGKSQDEVETVISNNSPSYDPTDDALITPFDSATFTAYKRQGVDYCQCTIPDYKVAVIKDIPYTAPECCCNGSTSTGSTNTTGGVTGSGTVNINNVTGSTTATTVVRA